MLSYYSVISLSGTPECMEKYIIGSLVVEQLSLGVGLMHAQSLSFSTHVEQTPSQGLRSDWVSSSAA